MKATTVASRKRVKVKIFDTELEVTLFKTTNCYWHGISDLQDNKIRQ